MNNKILWLGSYHSQKIFEDNNVKDIGLASSYTSQKAWIKGIDKILDYGDELDTIGIKIYPNYPKYKKIVVKKIMWSRTGKTYDCLAGFINLKYINYLTGYFSIKSEVNKWVKLQKAKKSYKVIIYAPSVSKLKAALKIKKRLAAQIYVIIPDIPMFVNRNANRIIKIAKKITDLWIKKMFKQVNGFILYSKHMLEYYGLKNEKCITIEGVFDEDELLQRNDIISEKNHDEIRLMYSGAIHEGRGIPQLLKAFNNIKNENLALWITGEGPSDELVHEYEKKDKRIKHFGFMKTRQEVLILQSKADILIHTRDITAAGSALCFPSKILEYLVSEKPVLSVVIPGIPDEYYKYLIPIESLSVYMIEKAICSVIGLSSKELLRRGKMQKEFIMQNKTGQEQAKKLLLFMSLKYKN